MTRLILASYSMPEFTRPEFADLAAHFYFRFVWGPLPPLDEFATYLGPRAPARRRFDEHWSDFMAKRSRSKNSRRGDPGLAEFCLQCETVELWFDTHPNAQLLLIWLLDYFRSHPETIARLKLRLVHAEMIRLERLGKWHPQAVDVTSDLLETASAAWQAYCEPTPEACFDLLRRDLSALPLLRPALVDLLAELPSATTGLGATEMAMLEMIARGHERTNDLFHLRYLRGTRIFGEWEHGYLLDALAHGPMPAVAGLDDELRTLDQENLRDRLPAYHRSRLSLTEFGKAIVAHQEDFSRHNPIDRWWGGTRLTNDRLWRWGPTLTKSW
jgi:hypothetical protein